MIQWLTVRVNHRDCSPNKYTVLLKFKTRQSAFACYQKFNGRRFNMTEVSIVKKKKAFQD
jgi:hypothetical protein